MEPTPGFLPGKFHGQRSVVGPCGCKELAMTEHTHDEKRVINSGGIRVEFVGH